MAIRDGEIRIRDQRWKKFGSVINMRRYKFLKIFVFQLFGEEKLSGMFIPVLHNQRKKGHSARPRHSESCTSPDQELDTRYALDSALVAQFIISRVRYRTSTIRSTVTFTSVCE
jgi:hypothetical protein